jgi:hypothetical protein
MSRCLCSEGCEADDGGGKLADGWGTAHFHGTRVESVRVDDGDVVGSW